MPLCKDPFLSHLKGIGANVVYPPRSTLNPLELMLKKRRTLERWGDTTGAFISTEPVPEIKSKVTIDSFKGNRAVTHDVSIGLTLLKTILTQLGASTVGIKASYKNAKRISFVYDGITSEFCDGLDLDKYFTNAHLDAGISTQVFTERQLVRGLRSI